jgi:excisionase family DNA binding protein
MNKKEAAEYLGVSTRLVEKYASEDRLGEVIYIRGRTGKQAEYDRTSVEKLKAELDTPDTAIAQHRTPDARLFVGQLVEALERREQANIEALRGLLEGGSDKPRSASIRVSEKILLTIDDCRLLTGMSRQLVRQAIEDGKLKGRIIGRAYRVKRDDLDAFIKKL